MVGKSGKSLILDPSPFDSMLFCQLWVLQKKLMLDRIGIHQIIFGNIHILRLKLNLFQFFQYLVKLLQKFLLSKKLCPPKVRFANGASLIDASKYL